MKNIYIKMIVGLIFLILISTTIGSSITYLPKNITTKKESLTRTENYGLELAIEPGFLYRGVELTFKNTGSEDLTNINWCFSTKAVITAIIGKGDVCSQVINELKAGEEITIVLRPYLSPTMPSPRGFGRVYMSLQAKANETEMISAQKQCFLLLCIIYDMKDTYIDIPPDKAYSLLMNDTFDLVIDVVGLDIYSLGHLPGAVNYVWADGTLEEEVSNLDINGTYLVYCHTDPPSTDSAQTLVDAGIKNTYRLEGNYRAWVEAGFPTET